MRILMLAAVVLSAASVPAVAASPLVISDIDGPCRAFTGQPVTTFPSGAYRLKGKDLNQRVTVTRKAGGVYVITAGKSGTAMLFANAAGTYVLRAETGHGQCTYSLATRVGDGLHVFSAYAAAVRGGITVTDTLPSADAAVNAAFFKKLAPYAGARGQLLFTALPED